MGAEFLSADAWEGRRVLLTGHTGFKGSWLAIWLQRLGAEVCGVSDRIPTVPSLFERADLARDVRTVYADVADGAALGAALSEFQPEIVFHLAAQSLVRRSYADPLETFRVNVLGTVTLLQAVRTAPSVRVVVNVTSDKCYENREWPWPYRESDPLGGHDPYSASKACAEIVTQAFRRSFFALSDDSGVAIASVRAGNVIGGGDWSEDRLIPDIVRAATAQRPAVLRHPNAVRPWQDVRDCLHGYLLLAQALWRDAALAGPWNFGPEPSRAEPVSRIVELVERVWPGFEWLVASDDAPHEAATLSLDSSRVRRELGWRPLLTLEESVADLVSWYRREIAGDAARALCEEQLETLMERIGTGHT